MAVRGIAKAVARMEQISLQLSPKGRERLSPLLPGEGLGEGWWNPGQDLDYDANGNALGVGAVCQQACRIAHEKGSIA